MESLKHKTAKGLFWGAMNNGLMQLIGVVFGIMMGRLLDPQDYGMIAMITIFSLVATTLQNSGFSTALVHMKAPQANDYNSVFWFNVMMGVSLYVVLYFCAPYIADYYHIEQLIPFSRYAFIAIIFSSLSTVQSAYIQKHLMVRQRAISNVTSVLLSSSVGVLMAWRGFGYWALATQTNLYVFLNAIFYWYFSAWRPSLHIDFGPVRRMFRFSSKLLATTIITQINNNVLNVLLGRYFSARDTGYYNQAFQWNSKAFYLIQGMVDSVALPVLVDLRDDAEREIAALRKMMRFTAFLSFPFLLGFGLVAREFIVLALKDKWLPSAILLQYLSVAGAILPLCTLLTNLIISKGKSNIYLGCTTALCVVQLVLIILLWHWGIHVLVISNVIVNVIWLFVWHHFAHRLIHYSLPMFLRDIIPFALAAVGVMFTTYWLTVSIHSLPWLLAARILIAAVLYFCVMKVARVAILEECILFVKSKIRRS